MDVTAGRSIANVLAGHGVAVDEGQLADDVEAALGRYLSASGVAPLSDAETAVLSEGGLDFASTGAYDRAARRAAADFVTLLATAAGVEEAARKIGRTRPRVQQMISAGELWAVRDVRGRWRLPALQFLDGDPVRVLPGLAQVLRALPANTHPLEVAAFLTTPQPELELGGTTVSPREWLASGGEPAQVAAIATGLREGAA
jgi:hypothetical protein